MGYSHEDSVVVVVDDDDDVVVVVVVVPKVFPHGNKGFNGKNIEHFLLKSDVSL